MWFTFCFSSRKQAFFENSKKLEQQKRTYLILLFFWSFFARSFTFWLQSGFHLASIQLQSGFKLASSWLQSGFHLASIQLQSGFNLASIWLPSSFNLASIQLQSGFNLPSIWLQSGFNPTRLHFIISSSSIVSTSPRKSIRLLGDSRSGDFKLNWHVVDSFSHHTSSTVHTPFSITRHPAHWLHAIHTPFTHHKPFTVLRFQSI